MTLTIGDDFFLRGGRIGCSNLSVHVLFSDLAQPFLIAYHFASFSQSSNPRQHHAIDYDFSIVFDPKRFVIFPLRRSVQSFGIVRVVDRSLLFLQCFRAQFRVVDVRGSVYARRFSSRFPRMRAFSFSKLVDHFFCVFFRHNNDDDNDARARALRELSKRSSVGVL